MSVPVTAHTGSPGPAAAPQVKRRSRLSSLASSPSLRVLGKRILIAIPVLWGVTFLTFLVLNILPGDAASQLLGIDATQAEIRALTLKLHLNEPVLVRYWHWLSLAARGNLGNSLASGEPVSATLGRCMPVTFELVGFAFILTLVISVPVAVLAARRPGGVFDRSCMVVSMAGLSIAQFVLALILVLLFCDTWHLLPALASTSVFQSFGQNMRNMILPAVTIAFPLACFYARLLRADLLEQMDTEDYIVTARAKGLGNWRILLRHALRNSFIGLLTIIGLNLATLLGTTVIVEEIFGLPGIGQQLLTAISNRDAPMLEGIVLIFASVAVFANLATDLIYGIVDPRIRHGRSPV